MHRVDLPDGNWADLSDPDEITEGQRRPMKVAFMRLQRSATQGGYVETGDEKVDMKAVFTHADPEAILATEDAVIDALVRAWSFAGEPSAASAQSLPTRYYDALEAEIQKLNLVDMAVNANHVGDPEAREGPTGPSNGSGMPLEGERSEPISVPNGVTTGS